MFTNFTLAVGVEHDSFLLPIATSLTAGMLSSARDLRFSRRRCEHENRYHCRALARFLFLPIRSRLTQQLTVSFYQPQVGSRFFDAPVGKIIRTDRILAETGVEDIRIERPLLRGNQSGLPSHHLSLRP